MSDDDIQGPLCTYCLTPKPMRLVRVTPKVGVMPELHTFLCSECGDVTTREVNEEA
jgi:hypothetical protein